MSRREFLEILRSQLSGQMSQGKAAAHVRYYEDYIQSQVHNGRSEEEVLAELGDPRLIARTLIDTDDGTEVYDESGYTEESYGADDYVVKPFSMKVLLKRIEAVIGRNNREKQLACGEIILFSDKKKVYKNGKEIILTAKEYQLLEYLMYNQGNVLTKENILEHVWGLDGQFVGDNTVSVTINRLRKKIETDAGSPVYLKNVFGLGYKLECV